MEEITIQGINDCKYDLNGNLYFKDRHNKQYKIHAKDALEIAYTLFDSVGHSYAPLEDIEDELI